MAAKDKYHEAVAQALRKAGWTVISQYELIVGGRSLFIDIQATKNDLQIIILVEVKGFERMASPVSYLADSVGQYVLYRAILEDGGSEIPLYMAVPEAAYEGILSEPIGQIAIERLKIKLLIFDPFKEEIVRWI
jgi:hypothetical protein